MIPYSVFTVGNAMKLDEAPKAYAKHQVRDVLSTEVLCRKVAEHSAYSRGAVMGLLIELSEVLTEELLNGNRVKFGELGTFGVSLHCEPADREKDFTKSNIKSVDVTFTPSEVLLENLSYAEFIKVESRVKQRAAMKANKAGESLSLAEMLRDARITPGE
jgi:predicted histone-like DNA-binding protein